MSCFNGLLIESADGFRSFVDTLRGSASRDDDVFIHRLD